jgi:hypothetical protein
LSVANESGKEVEVASKELPMTKIPRIRLPIKAAQVHLAKALKKKREFNEAFKHTTMMYDQER